MMYKRNTTLMVSLSILIILTLLAFIACGMDRNVHGSSSQITTDGTAVIPSETGGAGFATKNGQVDDETRRNVLREHCWSLPGTIIPGYHIRFEAAGERLPIESIAGGNALEPAAAFYAILTLDFDVSLRDVVENGFWPFDVFPTDSMLDMKLYDFDWQMPVAEDQEFTLVVKEPVGSPEWFMKCRTRVLESFYTEYFFENDIPAVHLSNMPGELILEFWDYDLLPDESFGINGSYLGEVVTVPAERFRQSCHADIPQRQFDLLWVNYLSTNRSISPPHQGANSLIGQQRTVSDGDDCCLFERHQVTDEDGMEGLSETICCPCTQEVDYCCTWTWDYESYAAKQWWTFVGCVPCDTLPPPNHCIRSYGQRAPRTTYASVGYATNITEDCDDELQCVLYDEECYNEIINFQDDLLNSNSVSVPGPMCTQCGKSGSSASSYGCCGKAR